MAAASSSSSSSSASSSGGKGGKFTIAGPPSVFEAGLSDILDDPELLWLEDTPWDEARYEEAQERVKLQGKPLTEHWYREYTTKAGRMWGKFYKRNGDRFYKDRHYLHAEFPEVLDPRGVALLEVGCGVGNAVMPILELNTSLSVHAIDFADTAIEILRQTPFAQAHPDRLQSSVCDVVNDPLPVPDGSQDLVLCMFVLSAIAPEHHLAVLQKLSACLKGGGKLLIRDYGRYDEAQLRFKKGSLLADNFYVRSDGTCAYYFSLEELTTHCCDVAQDKGCGLVAEESRCVYVRRQMANRQQRQARHRVWLQGVFKKGGQLDSEALSGMVADIELN